MIAKFHDEAGDHVLEIDKRNDGISFSIYHINEEEIGQYIVLPLAELNSLIKFLQSQNLLQ